MPLAPYVGHDPAQVVGDCAPLLRRVARRARVLGDCLFVERDGLVERLFLIGFGAYAARDLCGVLGVVALDFAYEHVGAQLFLKRAYAEVESAQARDIFRRDEGPRARSVAEHDRRADRECFERAARFGEDKVVFGENLLRLFEQVAAVLARNVEQQPSARARLAHDRVVVEHVVAEDESAARLFGERRARLEAFEVERVQEDARALLTDAALKQQSVAARVVNGDVAVDARVAGRSLLPGTPAVAEEDGGRAQEVSERRHRFDVVLAVYDVGRRGDFVEVFDDGDGRSAQTQSEFANLCRVDDGRVAAALQREREVADAQFSPRPARHRVVRDEDAQAAHQRLLSTCSQSASASGRMCSPKRITCSYKPSATLISPCSS